MNEDPGTASEWRESYGLRAAYPEVHRTGRCAPPEVATRMVTRPGPEMGVVTLHSSLADGAIVNVP